MYLKFLDIGVKLHLVIFNTEDYVRRKGWVVSIEYHFPYRKTY